MPPISHLVIIVFYTGLREIIAIIITIIRFFPEDVYYGKIQEEGHLALGGSLKSSSLKFPDGAL